MTSNGRSPADSFVEMTEIVLPEDTNSRGTIFGGRVLALVDKCAAVAAMRHARGQALTVSVDSVVFKNTVRVGQVLILHGWLNAAFNSSMEIEVEVLAEDLATGARRLTTTAYVTLGAVDDRDRPTHVPPLLLTTDDERRRAVEAAERRRARLSQRPGS